MACELCVTEGGLALWRDARWRVVRVDSREFPAYYRVICNDHVAEFSDLLAPERQRCMQLVVTVERVLREQLAPTKVNLASLGNATPHLHWHVIARFDWDCNYPLSIWVDRQRDADVVRLDRVTASLPILDATLAATLAKV